MESLANSLKGSRLSRSINTFQNRERWLYTCEHCGSEVEPIESGGYYARGQCQCQGAVSARNQELEDREKQRRQYQLAEYKRGQERAGLVKALALQTFETFDRSVQPEAYDIALSFFDEPRSMVFAGRTNGLGKTHLSAAIANRCVEQGKSVRFGTLAEYLAQIKATYNQEPKMTTDAFLEQLTHSYLLCIDDLGKERLTEWGREQLFLIVNARYNLRPEGLMVLTSNAEGQELAASMGIHNWSRMQEIATVVYMKGTDYRMRRKR